MRGSSLVMVVFGVACSEEVPAQLEAIEVVNLEADVAGRVAVDGADRDWSLALEDRDLAIEVHSPTAADLSSLDGRELTVAVDGTGPLSDTGTVSASDTEPVWLAYRNGSTAVPDAWFGPGFAALGAEVAHERVDVSDVRRRVYHTVAFRTDDGPVELLPGAVDTLVVDGVSWRVGVVAAYLDLAKPTNDKCGGGDEPMISYELLRVDAAVAPETVAPEAGRAIPEPEPGCGG